MEKVFIGIDFSKLFFDVAILEDVKQPQAMVYHQFSNDLSGCQQMIQWIKKQTTHSSDKWLFCGEHTGLYSVKVSEFLFQHGFSFWLESGLQIKLSMGLCRGKTDQLDAGRIALYAYRFSDKARLYEPQQQALSELKDLQAYRSRLVKHKTSLMVSSKELAKVKHNATSLFIYQDSLSLIKELEVKIKQIEKKIDQLIKSSPCLLENYRLLVSIKGMGPQNITAILVVTNNFQLFTDPRKFGCYCGVVPFPHTSGTSVKSKDKISGLANRKIKALLTQAARSASIYNPYYRQYYKKKITEGKKDRLVINNIKNKLIHLIFAMVRNKQVYDPNYIHQMNQSA